MKKNRIVNLFERKGNGLIFNIPLIFLLVWSTSCSDETDILDKEVIAAAGEYNTLLSSATSLSPTVIVDADRSYNTSGRNDMDIVRKYFYSGTLCNDNLSANSTQRLYSEEIAYGDAIKLRGARSINAERSCSLDAKGGFVPSSYLKDALANIHNHQWRLHLVVGQTKPPHLSGNAWQWNATQWNAYEKYVYEFLKHVMNDFRGGFTEGMIEVSNEVDIAGPYGYWFVEGKWANHGDLKAFYGLMKCYAEWSDAVKRFNRDFPSKKVKLIGPAMTVYTMWWCKDANNWALKFIEECKAKNYQMDGVSFHQYGAEMLNLQPDYSSGKNPSFKSTIKKIQDKLNSNGFTNAEIWITEWGCSNWINTNRVKNNYRPVGGAFVAAIMVDALDSGVDGMVPLRFRDPNGSNTWTEIGSLATNNGKIYPKPTYNVFRMFNQLPGFRRKLAWQNQHYQLGAIAAASDNQVGVIVYNYDWDDIHIVDNSLPHDVQIKIAKQGVKGNVTVKRYLVDSEHSNLGKYIDAGKTPVLEDVDLEQVEEFTVQASNGTIILPARTLGKSAVSMWVINLN
ncbi:MAG: glycosyl hydrolase [Mangrovibacterium sp.]